MIYNLSDLLFKNLDKGMGEGIAHYFENQSFTYSQIADHANRIGNALKSLNIPPKARIKLLMYDKPAFPAVFFGGIKAGYVMVLTNPNLQPNDYELLLNDSQATALVVDASILTKVKQIQANCPHLKHVIVLGKNQPDTYNYDTLINEAQNELIAAPTNENDDAFILYSSGSSGNPKGAVHLHKNVSYTIEGYANHILNISKDDIICSVSKMFFAFGFGNSISFPYGVGASSLILPAWLTPEIVFDHIEKYRPTIFCAIPTFYQAMLTMPHVENRDVTSLRMCVSGGEKLPKLVYENWRKVFGLEILQGMGTTEMLHIFISNFPNSVNPESIGRAVPGYEIKIIDETGIEVDKGKSGSMMIKGGSSAKYYLNNPEKTAMTMQNDWILMNDRCHQDMNGYFYFEGRSDDMFKVGGQWISPVELEDILLEHPSVKDCVVGYELDNTSLLKTTAMIILNQSYCESDNLKNTNQSVFKN